VNDGYIAAIDQVLPLVEFAVNEGLAQPERAVYENVIPVYFNRGFLDAVELRGSSERGAPHQEDITSDARRTRPAS